MSEREPDFVSESENVIPDNLPDLPVGTLEEIEAQGLNPAYVPTCHKQVMNGGRVEIVGCKYRRPDNDVCKLNIRDKAGPQFFGIEYLKGKPLGGAMIRAVRDCFYIARFKENIQTPENGGSFRIIATEGKSFKTTVCSPETGYKDKIVDVVVPHFPRPGENPDLVKEQLKAQIRAEERERVADEQFKRNAAVRAPKAKPEGSGPAAGGGKV